MTTIREAKAIWKSNVQDGHGVIDLDGGVQGQFDRETRYTEGQRHNPETLAAGALAGCYAMSLAGELAEEGFTPSEIRVSTKVALEANGSEAPFIPTISITARAHVNRVDKEKFSALANAARVNCPIANLFSGAEVALEADVVGG